MFNYVLLLVFIIVFLDSPSSACYTPWGSQGQCVKIKTCDTLLTVLKQQPLTNAAKDILRGAQCGFEGKEPKVCCQLRGKPSKSFVLLKKPLLPKPVTTEKIVQTTTTSRFSPPPVIPVDSHPHIRLLENDRCGPIRETRVYGGTNAAVNEFPWMAVLGYNVNNKLEFRCGGTLINKRYVLTAAHCVTGLPPYLELVSVRLGEYDLGKKEDCDEHNNGVGFNCASPYQEFGIDHVVVHSNFTSEKLQDDIALVRLYSEADLTPLNVRPICLPLGNTAFMGSSKGIVTGWGLTEVGRRSDILMKAMLPIVDLAKCSLVHEHRFIKLWYKQICAGGQQKMDSCSGDSGGPLQAVAVVQKKQRIVQYGIVSFGSRSCGVNGFPAVYTNVAYYVRWILDNIGE